MSRANRLKVQNAWLKIMRLAKVRLASHAALVVLIHTSCVFVWQVDSLRKDVEIASQSHERDVDRKDAVLQMMDRDLDEAEDQYQLAMRQHLRNIDRLVELQVSRIWGDYSPNIDFCDNSVREKDWRCRSVERRQRSPLSARTHTALEEYW
jgi:hypothetical protein